MSLKPVRSFLASRLLEIDPDFTEHDNAFSTDNIGQNDFDKRFHIFYGNVSTTSSNQQTTSDVVSATVNLYFNGHRGDSVVLDDALDVANKFRLQCLKQKYIYNQQFIKKVVSQNIEALPLNTNDNAINIRLTFNISVIFGLDVDLDC